jgi:hypothetical protein
LTKGTNGESVEPLGYRWANQIDRKEIEREREREREGQRMRETSLNAALINQRAD